MQTHLTILSGPSDSSISRPTLCLLPGGPGLSSKTLQRLEVLRRSFRVVLVDPPGTGSNPEPENPTFGSVVESIEQELRRLSSPLLLCGHSFGALYAAELARRAALPTVGLIAVAAPFSKKAYEVACALYEKSLTSNLKAASDVWENHPTRENLAALFASYQGLYFPPETVAAGSNMLLQDKVSPSTFKAVLPALSAANSPYRFELVAKAVSVPKLFVAGDQDVLFPVNVLRQEAQDIGAAFEVVAGAGHFVPFDQPEAIAGLIERYFINGKTRAIQ